MVKSELDFLKRNRNRTVSLSCFTAFIAVNFYTKLPMLGLGAYITVIVLSCTLFNPKSKTMPGWLKWMPLVYLLGAIIAFVANFFYVVKAIFNSTDGIPASAFGIILFLLVFQVIHLVVIQGLISQAVLSEKQGESPAFETLAPLDNTNFEGLEKQSEKPEKVILRPSVEHNTVSGTLSSKTDLELSEAQGEIQMGETEIFKVVSNSESLNEVPLEPELAIDKYLMLKMKFQSNPNASFKALHL